MFDAVRNVGVKGAKIAAITKDKIKGNETIDAKGHVVAPGFIDTHHHALDELAVKMGIRDGVTTGMDLEWGALNVDQWYPPTGWSPAWAGMTIIASMPDTRAPRERTARCWNSRANMTCR